jgi:hypothetical protein
MNTADKQVLPAPPSLMKSLKAGFDAITNHIELILFPIALDLFLWFGPHFSLSRPIRSFVARVEGLPEAQTPEMVSLLSTSREAWLVLAERFNLFVLVRAYPVGLPSLMGTISPVETPLGTAPVVELASLSQAFGLGVLFVLVGLTLGSLYFSSVAQASLVDRIRWGSTLRSWPWAAWQTVLLALIWLAIIAAIALPFACLLSLLMVTGFSGGPLALFLFGGLLAWFLLPLVFSAHGIFASGLKVVPSIFKGVRLTRMTLPSTGFFLLALLFLSQGTDVLWSIPPENSWLGLVSIAGHAFVTTALLAASFIYYRDASRWLERVIQQAQFANIRHT